MSLQLDLSVLENGNNTLNNSGSSKPPTSRSHSRQPSSSTATTPRLPTVLTAFHWIHGGNEVYISGSFNGWKERLLMEDEGNGVFSKTLELPVGIHSYKYIVDGVWEYAPDQQIVTDDKGNINNGVNVTLPLDYSGYRSAAGTRRNSRADETETETDHDPTGSPRDKPLKNQFLMSGVYSGADNTSVLSDRKLILVMVGLPARGKSFVSRKLCRYLTWMGYQSKVFNLGNYRREQLGSFHSHDFFRPDNPEGMVARNKIAHLAMDDVFNWLHEGGRVAIYDGTNTTIERRKLLLQRVKQEKIKLKQAGHGGVKVIFIEIICNNPEVIDRNILGTKLSSPDYVNVEDKSKIIADFRERIAHYEQAYQTISDDNLSYVKIFEVGRQIVSNRIYGFLPSRIVFFLNNLHIVPHPIYLCRHGESEDNVTKRLGGDAGLTKRGKEFAQALGTWMQGPIEGVQGCAKERVSYDFPDFKPDKDLFVWSSTMKRSIQTASAIPCAQSIRWKALDEVNIGVFDGLTEEEIKQKYPEETKPRANKLTYRYPRGESYEDVIRRVEPIIIELERQRKPVIIVAHRAVLRCLIGYFSNKTPEEIPYIDVPLHTVVKIMPVAYGTIEQRFNLLPEPNASPHPSDVASDM